MQHEIITTPADNTADLAGQGQRKFQGWKPIEQVAKTKPEQLLDFFLRFQGQVRGKSSVGHAPIESWPVQIVETQSIRV